MEWQYPKKINNTLDLLIAESITHVKGKIVECKRCGKEFKQKGKDQKFCSRECCDKYYSRLKEYKETYGKDFTRWLDNKIL